MISVKEYFKNGNTIFDDADILNNLQSLGITFLTEETMQIIDYFIKTNFGPCLFDVDDEASESQIVTDLKMMALALIIKNQYLYDGIYKALTTTFDPLNPTNIEETEEIEKSGDNTKTGREVDSGSSSQTQTPNLTTQTNPASTVERQNRTFDNATLTAYEKEINGGSDTTTQTGTNTIAGTTGNTKEFQDVKDEYQESLSTTKSRTGRDNIDFRKAIEDYYATKLINLVDRIVNDFATEQIIPLYYF